MMERMLTTRVLSGTVTNVLLVKLQKRLVLVIMFFFASLQLNNEIMYNSFTCLYFFHRDEEGLRNLFNPHFVNKVSVKKLV